MQPGNHRERLAIRMRKLNVKFLVLRTGKLDNLAQQLGLAIFP